MVQELRNIAYKYNLNYIYWGGEGGNGWIWYKQEDEKKFKIQVCVNGNFEIYKKIKDDIVNLFLSYNCCLSNEQDIGTNIGYRKNLYFTDIDELQTQIKEKEEYIKRVQAPTYNIGHINADGSIVTLGNVINSTQSIDNSIQQIENLIEKKGADDKEELYAILYEAKEIIYEIYKTREIKPKNSFIEELSNHLSKHSWFYGAIVNLLGTALIATLG